MNELALIFDRIGIDTNDVIEAAGTKWNFRKYRPGLVGGHCICRSILFGSQGKIIRLRTRSNIIRS